MIQVEIKVYRHLFEIFTIVSEDYLLSDLFVLGARLKKTILFFALLFVLPQAIATDVIRYVQSERYPDPKEVYFVDLLTLVLEQTKAQYGEYRLEPVAIEMAQERTSLMIARGEYVDLTWRMTSKSLEEQLQAVYFPLVKGTMGHRIFIIRKGEQPRFKKGLTLDDLKQIPLGQGYNWADSKILKHHGFSVVEGYDIYLLKMLERKRFDYFPRALHEPWTEIGDQSRYVVEQNYLIKYPSPIYFFVSNKNQRLAARLTSGMAKLIESGEFDHFFKTHPITRTFMEKIGINNRTIYQLDNPLMSSSTRELLKDERLWLKVENP